MKRMMIRLGRVIRTVRQAMPMTQQGLARKTGLHYTFLGHIERGNKGASLETLVKIGKALHTPAWQLLQAAQASK